MMDEAGLTAIRSGRVNAPLLFDRRMMTKPAFWGVIDRSLIPDAVADMP